MTDNAQPGNTSFYVVTNGQIYQKVSELEHKVTKITTIFSVITFIVGPLITVVLTISLNKILGS